tara:strand:+ start:7045 stop:9297 length:2253 start_codon:yes stop_codon:yes gene_type:complete
MAESFFYTEPFASEFDVPTDFLGGVAVDREEQEEDRQLNIPSNNEGAPTLKDLADILVSSGLLQKTVADFGTGAAVGAATGIGAGGSPVFNSTFNALTSAGATAAEATAAASQAAGASAVGEASVFGLNPITAAYLLYNVGRAVGKSISGQTDPNRFELTRLQNYDPRGAYKLKDKSVVQRNAALRDLASQLIELGWDSDRGIQQQLTRDNDPAKIQQFLELVLDNPLLTDFYTDVGYLSDPEETKEFYNSLVEQGAEDTTAQDEAAIRDAQEAAEEALTAPEDNPDVIAANDAVTEAQTAAQAASDNVTTVINETNASVTNAENSANFLRRRYGPFSSIYRSAKKRADAAKLDAQNKVNQARTAASVALADYENAVKLQQGTYKDAQDAYAVAQVEARRAAEEAARQRIAERKEQERIQRTTDTDGDGVYDFVDLFPDDPTEWQDSDGDGVGDVAQRLAQEQAAEAERERQRLEEEARKAREAEEEQEEVVVPVEPIQPPEEPPLDIAPPVVEPPVEEPTTGGGGDEGTPTADPVEPVEPVDDFEDPIEGDDPEFPWVYLGNGVFRHSKTGEELYDEQVEENPNYVVGSFYSGPKSSGEEEEDRDLPIVPSPFDDDDEDDIRETPITVDPPTIDPVDPIEDPEPVQDPVQDPIEDPTGGVADTGTGVGDTGTGGGEGGGDGIGRGLGAGIGTGLAVGLAAGMLKPRAVTKTLFEDFEFKKTYQAPEIIPGLSDLPTYKAPSVGLFQGII